MKSKAIVRIRFVFGALVLFALVLIFRLYDVQITDGDTYSDRADRQYVRTTGDLYDRGNIFMQDRGGRLVSGATLKTGYTLALSPKNIDEPEDVYNRLSNYIDVEEEDFLYRVRKTDDPYEEIARRLEPEMAHEIADQNLKGVNVYKDRWRFYPGDSLAAQTLGFVAYDDEHLRGVYGVERYYNDILARDEASVNVNFFAEVFANLNKTLFRQSSSREGDVITSLEPSVQLFLERKLAEVQDEWDSKLTAGIIMNPKDGEIYALAVNPTFDLNTFREEEDISIFGNPLVENVYEMGSIVKPLTMAAGLDAGAVTADTSYYDAGFIELDGYTIGNFDGKGRGYVTMQEVLNQSLNTGVSFVVSEMGNDVFAKYMRAYGIGEETGIDLPNESAGITDNLDSPRDIEYATASFGQGIAMTPIATIRALATLANGGVLVTPHVATKIKYKNGLSKTVSYNDGERVLQPETAEEITQMLVRVVDKALLNGEVKLDNYSVAAKTGTAQIAKVDERGYYDDRFLHSFFGYFPAYEPLFLVFLMTVEPKEVRYASQTLTYPFMDTVKFLTNYYEVPPDR
jgi:cell division protein FtsI/penicillin-binding protein 2